MTKPALFCFATGYLFWACTASTATASPAGAEPECESVPWKVVFEQELKLSATFELPGFRTFSGEQPIFITRSWELELAHDRGGAFSNPHKNQKNCLFAWKMPRRVLSRLSMHCLIPPAPWSFLLWCWSPITFSPPWMLGGVFLPMGNAERLRFTDRIRGHPMATGLPSRFGLRGRVFCQRLRLCPAGGRVLSYAVNKSRL